jgi:hypothetical protein
MKRKALISISLFPLVLFSQETVWDSLPWGSGACKAPGSTRGNAWIIPAVAVPAAAAAALLIWPGKEQSTQDPCSLGIIPLITSASCSSANGTIRIVLSDSTSPQVTWPDGLTASSRNDLRAGSYPVVVAYGDCTDSMILEVSSVNIPVPLLLLDVTQPSAPGIPDGIIVASIDPPGNSPYLFTVNGRDSILVTEPLFIAEGLAEGEYTLEVMDAHGCTGSLTVVLKAETGTSHRHRAVHHLYPLKRSRSFRVVFTPLYIPTRSPLKKI